MHSRVFLSSALFLSAIAPGFADNIRIDISDFNNRSGTVFLNATSSPAPHEYLITSASGMFDGSTVSLLAPGSYPLGQDKANDNLLFFPATLFDSDYQNLSGNGISLRLSGGRYFNLYQEEGLTFSTIGVTPYDISDQSHAGFVITQTGPLPVSPEPSTYLLLSLGLGVLAFGHYRRAARPDRSGG